MAQQKSNNATKKRNNTATLTEIAGIISISNNYNQDKERVLELSKELSISTQFGSLPNAEAHHASLSFLILDFLYRRKENATLNNTKFDIDNELSNCFLEEVFNANNKYITDYPITRRQVLNEMVNTLKVTKKQTNENRKNRKLIKNPKMFSLEEAKKIFECFLKKEVVTVHCLEDGHNIGKEGSVYTVGNALGKILENSPGQYGDAKQFICLLLQYGFNFISIKQFNRNLSKKIVKINQSSKVLEMFLREESGNAESLTKATQLLLKSIEIRNQTVKDTFSGIKAVPFGMSATELRKLITENNLQDKYSDFMEKSAAYVIENAEQTPISSASVISNAEKDSSVKKRKTLTSRPSKDSDDEYLSDNNNNNNYAFDPSLVPDIRKSKRLSKKEKNVGKRYIHDTVSLQKMLELADQTRIAEGIENSRRMSAIETNTQLVTSTSYTPDPITSQKVTSEYKQENLYEYKIEREEECEFVANVSCDENDLAFDYYHDDLHCVENENAEEQQKTPEEPTITVEEKIENDPKENVSSSKNLIEEFMPEENETLEEAEGLISFDLNSVESLTTTVENANVTNLSRQKLDLLNNYS